MDPPSSARPYRVPVPRRRLLKSVALAIGGFENGLIGRLREPLRLEQLLHFLRAQLLGQIFRRFFEHGVFRDFLRDHIPQLEPVQLQNRNHLDQPRREDLLLRDFYLQSRRQQAHLA
jgi:hypothetical protein